MEEKPKPLKPTDPDVTATLPGYYPDPPPYQPYPPTLGTGPYFIQVPGQHRLQDIRCPPGAHVIQIQGPVVTGRAPISIKPRPHVIFCIFLWVLLVLFFCVVPAIVGIIFAVL
ncbi:hypothetical protein KP79_PYT18078 [Mizuhopecten yessoensis]|uniref:Uncharacterized protein n=1 Tax=Mizuhopecten yessoensis TaxID=6573 RepID=A0A210PV61_MIZYE|nr:hypothetical protein KP79_PYT18078 [Mizuhopecten yessoensis]